MVLITEIDDRRISKPFLGGYVNSVTSVEYFNAASQTGPPRKRREWQEKARTRQVQCVEVKESACQPSCNRTTQTFRKDYYIPNISDTYLTAKPYETHEKTENRLNLDGNARTIQRSYRAYRLLKYIKECAREYRQILENCRKLEEEKAKALRTAALAIGSCCKVTLVRKSLIALVLRRHEHEIRRQTYPRSRADFEKLYNLIESWRVSRLDAINKKMFPASIRSENYRMLERTTEMLAALDRHKQRIADDRRETKRLRFLTENCEPIRWNGYKAKPVEMVTLRIQKARECKSIYEELTRKDRRAEDIIELSILLKNSLSGHRCSLVDNLIRLLDQEIVLLSCGIENSRLDNLRNRISTAYLQFVSGASTCSCAPADPNDPSVADFTFTERSRTKKLLCRSCMKMFPYRDFAAHVRMKKLSCCSSCTWLRQQNIDKSHYGPYTFLLNGIRADERKRNCYSSLLYVIREPGIYHLVNNIWHGRSAVSENSDLFNLRLVRWNIDEEWSPWNCILLTSDEAETHYFVKDFTSFYSKRLLSKIYLTHLIAKTHFRELISFERKFRVSSRYYVIQDRRDYEPSKSES